MPKTYCFCKQRESDRFMIRCDGCHEWFHGDCVAVPEKASRAMQNQDWFCPVCAKLNFWKSSLSNKLDQQIEALWMKLFQEKEGMIRMHMSNVRDKDVNARKVQEVERTPSNLLENINGEHEKEIETPKTDLVNAQQELNNLHKEFEKWKVKHSETCKEVEQLQNNYNVLENVNADLQKEIETLKTSAKELKDLHVECEEWKLKHSEASKEVLQLQNHCNVLENVNRELRKEVDKLKTTATNAQEQLKDLHTEFDSWKVNHCKTSDQEVNRLQEEILSLGIVIEGLKKEASEPAAKRRVTKLSLSQHKMKKKE